MMQSAGASEYNALWEISTNVQPRMDLCPDPASTQAPIRIDDTGRRLRLPGFVQNLATQYPPAGMFTVNDLDWKFVGTGKQMGLVAAFPRQRLDDFRIGESHRGGCKVLIGSYKATTDSVLLNDRGLCVFVAPSYAMGKKRQAAAAAAAEPEPCAQTECGVARYGRSPDAQSKKNCAYCCYARVYAKCQGVVIVKFPCYEGDTAATCMTMKHCTPDGEPAHVGVQGHRHLRQWSSEATSLIISKLKLQTKPAVIIQEVKKSILQWLKIPEDSPPEHTRQLISASRFGKDFYVNNSRIQYLRRKYVDNSCQGSAGNAATAAAPWHQEDSSPSTTPPPPPRPVGVAPPEAQAGAMDGVKQALLQALSQASLPVQQVGDAHAEQLRDAAACALDALRTLGTAAEPHGPTSHAVQPPASGSGNENGRVPQQERESVVPLDRGTPGAGAAAHGEAAQQVQTGSMPVSLVDERGDLLSQAWSTFTALQAADAAEKLMALSQNQSSKRDGVQVGESDGRKRAKCCHPPQGELMQMDTPHQAAEGQAVQNAQVQQQPAQEQRVQQLLLSLLEQQRQREEQCLGQLEEALQRWQQQQIWQQQWQQCGQLLQRLGEAQREDAQQQSAGLVQQHLIRLLGNRPAG